MFDGFLTNLDVENLPVRETFIPLKEKTDDDYKVDYEEIQTTFDVRELLDVIQSAIHEASDINEKRLEIKCQVQEKIIGELTKKLDKFAKQNAMLIKENKQLVKDRNVAFQTKVDLHNRIQELKDVHLQELKVKNIVKEPRVPRPTPKQNQEPQPWFDEDSILNEAEKELDKLKKDHEQGKFTQSCFSDEINRELAHYAADMLSIKKKYEPPSPIAIGYEHNVPVTKHLITTTNYHSKRFARLVTMASDHVNYLARTVNQENLDLLRAKTSQEYIEILHRHSFKTKLALFECLDALAEEQRLTRRWRVEYHKLQSLLEHPEPIMKPIEVQLQIQNESPSPKQPKKPKKVIHIPVGPFVK